MADGGLRIDRSEISIPKSAIGVRMVKVFRKGDPELEGFLARLKGRQVEPPSEVEAAVRSILADVKARGDQALFAYALKFDGACLDADSLKASSKEIQEAYAHLQPSALEALKLSHERIKTFHQRQLRSSWFVEEEGAILGQLVRAIENVGIYVPGGRAAYPSTVLMNAVPAQVVGVSRIALCTPVGPNLKVPPAVLVAADLCGVQEIYKVGGAQAMAALAYGTESIPKVDKIVGPGNIFVATAKRLLYGQVGIDMLAGPTEILIIADTEADPAYIAADMLAQAEHDLFASALLIALDAPLAEKVVEELSGQLQDLPRREIAEASLRDWGAIFAVETLEEAASLANRIAPEHVELLVQDPWGLLPLIKNAGAIFLGAFSPEAMGDYLAGPNHVLPTGGTACFSSPLSVEDFQHRSSVISLSKRKFEELRPFVVELAELENLTAHARSTKIRRER